VLSSPQARGEQGNGNRPANSANSAVPATGDPENTRPATDTTDLVAAAPGNNEGVGLPNPANASGEAHAPTDLALVGNAGAEPAAATAAALLEFVRTEAARGPFLGGTPTTTDSHPGPDDLLADEPTLAPESAGLLPDAGSSDLSAVERALQQFLDQLAALPQDFGDWLNRLGPVPWVLMGLAVSGLSHELLRRKHRQLRAAGGEGTEEVRLTWVAGLGEAVDAD
jgi:hypothetical protein